MKKIKRIAAWIGLILIAGMYAFSIYCAITCKPNTREIFLASVMLTVAVPTVIYIIGMFARLSKRNPIEIPTPENIKTDEENKGEQE